MMAFLSALWGISMVRKLALYAGIVLGLVALVALIYFRGKSAGKVAVQIESMKKSLDTERRMKDAVSNAPSDLDGARKRMRDGSY